MEISRRHLLKFGVLQAGALIRPAQSSASQTLAHRRKSPSIVQGATDAQRTQFSIVHQAAQVLRFEVANQQGQVWHPDSADVAMRPNQGSAVSQCRFSGLRPNEDFSLRVCDGKTGELVDQRTFRTLDTRGPRTLRFAICSCMDDSRHSPYIWRDLVSTAPDFILFVGDSVYCDYGDGTDAGPDRLWRRFAEARATLDIYFSPRLVPIFAVWDDHDFGQNDAGKDFPHAAASMENFLRYFAMESSHCQALALGPGLSSRLLMGNQQFLLMDDRSWREKGESNGRYGHWGREQEEWLMSQVAGFEGMNWIINGSQIFPQMPFKESFSGQHAAQFGAVMRQLRLLNAESGGRTAFISGDVHYSEISEIEGDVLGYVTYELTSSSVHSANIPGTPWIIPNKRRISATGERNYLLVEAEMQTGACRARVFSRSAGGEINFSNRLSIG